VDFRILGPLEVSESGRVLDLGGQKQRTLLAMLLLEPNRVVPVDQLVEALWEESPPETATKALQVYVSQLRKELGRGRLETRAPGYRLRVEEGELDVERFRLLCAAGRFDEALREWRGEPLSEFAHQRFAQIEIARLEELRLACLEERLEQDFRRGRSAELVAELEALVERYPLRERLRAQLMLALYRSDRQADALAAYQAARRALVEELGIEPGRRLRELHQAILRQDPSLELQPAAESPAEVEDVTPKRAAPRRHERKLATVLYAEAATHGDADPERMHAALEPFRKLVVDEVEAAGGAIEVLAGAGVMAVFGAPAAQEDHAERALHAALAVRDGIAGVLDRALELRIAVNSSEVLAGDDLITGDAVGAAARLVKAAAAGEILVGDRAAAAAAGAFEFDEPRRSSPGRRLLRAVALRRPHGARGLEPTFVGRERELALLRATYDRTVESGEPHVVTIVGEAGVGKTSLVRELAEWLVGASPPPLLRAGRCLPYGRGITYWPLGEVLKAHFGILESDPPLVVRERLRGREALGFTLGLEAEDPIHPLAAREQLHQAWLDLVGEVLAERPLVLLVEDLHWGEEPLFELLERLAREAAGPLLLLATARPELAERWAAGGAKRHNAAQIWLDPLSVDEAGSLLARLLGGRTPRRLQELVAASAEGNPFFVEELVASLVDRRVLVGGADGWRLDEAAALDVPDSVHSVLAARIDLLGPAEKAALQAAAVVGRVFWEGPVRELLGGRAFDLDVLVERDFVRRRPASTMAGEREFAFKHALTRDVAYAGLPKSERARLHAAFAGWIERTGGSRDEHASLLAHHFGEAVAPEHAELAWADREDEAARLREKALVWLRRAADLAAGRYALDEQIAFLTRAAELEEGDAVSELWQSIARANALRYDQAGFRAAMRKAIEVAGDTAAVADLYSRLAFWDAFRWNHVEDRELIEEWLERALELSPPGSAARARALVARSYCRPEEAEAAAREACAIAEALPDLELRSYAFHAVGDAMLAAGRYDEARRWAERRFELLDRIEDPDHAADVYWSAIPGYLGSGRFEDARRLARLHDEVTSTLSPHHRLHGVAFLLEVEELAAQWERIRSLTPRAEEAVGASTPCVHRPRSLVVCALAAACMGDDGSARRLEEAAAELGAEEYGRVVDARIRLALVRRDLDEVGRLVEQAETPQRTLIRSTKLAPIAARLDALAALGRREAVEAEAPRWLQPKTYLEPFALRALGLVRGDEQLVADAADRFAAMGLDWHASRTSAA
jgi:DNA-binding SARP family transcriptional activator